MQSMKKLKIFPKHIQLNGWLEVKQLKTIFQSIDISILSFGEFKIRYVGGFDYETLKILSQLVKKVFIYVFILD